MGDIELKTRTRIGQVLLIRTNQKTLTGIGGSDPDATGSGESDEERVCIDSPCTTQADCCGIQVCEGDDPEDPNKVCKIRTGEPCNPSCRDCCQDFFAMGGKMKGWCTTDGTCK